MIIDIHVIALAARVSPQVARYVVDQRLVPNARGRLQEGVAGRPRSFQPVEGFSLVCAARLYASGVQRKAIGQLFRWLAELPWPPPGTAPQRSLVRLVQTRGWTTQDALY